MPSCLCHCICPTSTVYFPYWPTLPWQAKRCN